MPMTSSVSSKSTNAMKASLTKLRDFSNEDLEHRVIERRAFEAVVWGMPAADEEGSITGSIDDAWQTALEDVVPAGADKGKGGKYLILPPGYKEKVPDNASVR